MSALNSHKTYKIELSVKIKPNGELVGTSPSPHGGIVKVTAKTLIYIESKMREKFMDNHGMTKVEFIIKKI